MITRRRFLGTTAMVVSSLVSGCRGASSTERLGRIPQTGPFELEELSVAQLRAGIASGRWTAADITSLYLDRIAALDRRGPQLGTVIRTNPDAPATAERWDMERAAGVQTGPLAGIPVVVKDNIDTADAMPTTAGSLALADAYAQQDAFLIARLRAAGAIILAKTNLSEWANFRGANSTSGWSAVGGQCRNPYALDRNPCGSSSGSVVAVSANMAPLAVGTETDGSIVCPAAKCGVVGIKPTVGLVSRSGVIPIAASQDTAGPIARTVADAALLLGAMAGADPDDPATQAPGAVFESDYTRFLDTDGLRGARIGVARNFDFDERIWNYFDASLEVLRDMGAVVVDPAEIPNTSELAIPELTVLFHEFKDGINRYLAGLDPGVPVHNLTELIAFNEANVEREMPYFGQEYFRTASVQDDLDDPVYLDARRACRRFAREEGIDRVMDELGLDALVSPEGGLPWRTDYERGDQVTGTNSRPAAVAGYPNITVPMGLLDGLPVGISFFGRAWSESTLIRLAYAYEQATRSREIPAFLPTAL